MPLNVRNIDITGLISYTEGSAPTPPPPPSPYNASLYLSGVGTNNSTNNTFLDSSSNEFTVTRVGDATQGSFTPFSSDPYNSSTMGGSMYFDGSDYLTIAQNDAFTFGSGDFTVEAWVYPKGRDAFWQIAGCHTGGSGADWLFAINNSGNIFGNFGYGGGTTLTSSSVVPLNAWSHVVMVRSSGTLTFYINGTNAGGSGSYASSITCTSNFSVGASNNGVNSTFANGYISNLRIVKGTAVYTGNFTAPTAPVTAIANTSLLLNGTNAAIVDTSVKNDLETVGDAKISTTISASGSMSFLTSGSKLIMPPGDLFAYGTGAFTIEAWVCPTQYNSSDSSLVFSQVRSGTNYLLAGFSTNGAMFFIGGHSTLITTSSIVPLNSWTHLAWVREGTGSNQFKMYMNGVLAGTSTMSYDFSDTSQNIPCIGNYQHENILPFYGYINDLRVTKGLARYTGTFTPPARS